MSCELHILELVYEPLLIYHLIGQTQLPTIHCLPRLRVASDYTTIMSESLRCIRARIRICCVICGCTIVEIVSCF